MGNNEKFLIIDTETIGNFGSHIVYDTGLLVVDREGRTYEEHSFLTKGIFDDIKLMATAFYARRYNKYLEEIANGTTKVVEWAHVLKTITAIISTYGITTVAAYNESFDDCGMANTTEHFFDNREWLPENVNHFCIWNAACHTIFDENYIELARAQGWVTEKDNVKTSAEMAYRYITGNHDFEEAHTGLDDCKIEAQILVHLLNTGKEFDSSPVSFPMRRVFELDRVWQIRDLERKEQEALEITAEIKRLFTKLKGRYKTIEKWRDKLNYNEPDAITAIEMELARGCKKERFTTTQAEGVAEYYAEK